MPALPAEVVNFLTLVKDNLTKGQDRGARASATIGSGANGSVQIVAKTPGVAGNSYSVTVTVPAGTAGLTVSLSGTDITVALAVNTGTPVTASNTAALVAAAINSAVTGVKASYTGSGASSLSTAKAKTAFTGGADVHVAVGAAGQNFIRAQDMATVLQLLQDSMTKSLTATGGSTTTAVVSSVTSGAYVGAQVTFAANTTTAALRGVTATVASNNATTFTFSSTLPAACANTDTFTIRQTFADKAISDLRGGKTKLGDSPSSNHFGNRALVLDALEKFARQIGGAALATRTLSNAGAQTGSGSTKSVIVTKETNMTIDQFRGRILTIGGVARKILRNDETTITVVNDFAAAPAANTAYTITVDELNINPGRNHSVHVGGQPDNLVLANFITQVQTAVEAFTLPS